MGDSVPEALALDISRSREFSVSGPRAPSKLTNKRAEPSSQSYACACTKSCCNLHAAAAANSTACLAAFLAAGADPNQFNEDGATPLYCTALSGSLDTMQALLAEQGININIGSKVSKNSPLMRAAHESNVEAVKLLLERGADVEHKSVFGLSALVCAVSANSTAIKCVRLLLEAGASTAVQCSDRQYSALHYAAHLKATDIIQALLEYAPDLALHCKIGRCFTHVSARQGDAASLRAALDAEAQPRAAPAGAVRAALGIVDSSGMTALHCALAFGHEEAAMVLLDAVPAPADHTLLRLAVSKQLVQCIRALVLQHSHDPDSKAKRYSVLYSAAVHCMPTVVRTLLEVGASTSDAACGGNILQGLILRLKSGEVGNKHEATRNRDETLKQLLNIGATGPITPNSDTPRVLVQAICAGVPDAIVVRLVLEAGFPANSFCIKSNIKESAVGKAIQLGRQGLAESLIAAGGLAQLPPDDTCHPALQAAKGGHAQLLYAMLQAADEHKFFSVVDTQGDSVLHWAVRSSDHGTVEAALALFPSPPLDKRNNEGETPLAIAAATDGVFSSLVCLATQEQLLERNALGHSLLHISAANGCIHNCKLLVDKLRGPVVHRGSGVVPPSFINGRVHPQGKNAPPVRGPTPLHLACAHGHSGVTVLLLLEGANPRLNDHAYVGSSGAASHRCSSSGRPTRRSSATQHLHKMGSGRSLLSGVSSDEQLRSESPALREKRGSAFALLSAHERGEARRLSDPFSHRAHSQAMHAKGHGEGASAQSNLAPVQPSSVVATRAPPSLQLHSIFERGEYMSQQTTDTEECVLSFQTDITGRTPLHLAAMNGHSQCVQAVLSSIVAGEGHALLLAPRLICEAADGAGATAAHLAAAGGHSESLGHLLTCHPASIFKLNNERQTPLHVAAEVHSRAAIDVCVDAVIAAREMGSLAKLQLSQDTRIKEISDSDDGNSDSSSTATLDSSSDSEESTAELDDWALAVIDARSSLTVELAAAGFVDTLARMVQNDICSLLGVDAYGNTALHAAVHAAQVACVEGLLRIGAEVNAQNSDGDTPLHMAAQQDDKLCIRVLLSGKPDLHLRNAVGCRPCDLVANPALQLQLTPLSRTLNWESLGQAELCWHIVAFAHPMAHSGWPASVAPSVPCQLHQFSEPAAFLRALCQLQSGGQQQLLTSFAARQCHSSHDMVDGTPSTIEQAGGEFGRISVKVNGSHTACAVKRLEPREGRTLQDLVQETEYEVRVQQSLQNTEHIARVLGCVQVPAGWTGDGTKAKVSALARSALPPSPPTAVQESTYDDNIVAFGANASEPLPAAREMVSSVGPSQQLASVAEYVPGSTWSWFVENLGAIAPPSIKLQLATSLVTAVQQLHAQEVAHRDLHGGNVMVCATADGWWTVKLIDFGLAYPWSAGADDYMRIALGRVHASLRRPRAAGACDAKGNDSQPKEPSRSEYVGPKTNWPPTKHMVPSITAADEYDFSCSAWMDVYGLAILLSWLYIVPSALPAAALQGTPGAHLQSMHPSYVGNFMLHAVWCVPGALGGGTVEECVLQLLHEIGVQPHRRLGAEQQGDTPGAGIPATKPFMLGALPTPSGGLYTAAGISSAVGWTAPSPAPGSDGCQPQWSSDNPVYLRSDYMLNSPPAEHPVLGASHSVPVHSAKHGRVDALAYGRHRSLGHFGPGIRLGTEHSLVQPEYLSQLGKHSARGGGTPAPPPRASQPWSMAPEPKAPPPPPPPSQRTSMAQRRTTMRPGHAGVATSPWARPTRDALESVAGKLQRAKALDA